MRIRNIVIENFRNIEGSRLELSPALNFINGRNGQGKTNLLEAIYLFSMGRSFRTRKRDEMIKLGEDSTYLQATVESDGGIKNRIEVGLERGGGSRVSVNGQRLKGFSFLIGMVPGVIFTPEDVTLTTGPPAERRLYIDYTASQLSEGFVEDLKEYKRILKQRNAVLKEIQAGEGGREVLGAIDRVMAGRAGALIAGREMVMEDVVRRAEKVFSSVFSGEEELGMRYVSSVGSGFDGYAERFLDSLSAARDEEISRGYTARGPHCDDIKISLGGLSLRKYGSQGRKRLIAIVLKMVQASVIRDRKGERPVVLLDDIFSELDIGVSESVKDFLSDNYQNFITSPVDLDFPEDGSFRRFNIEKGCIEEVAG